MPSVWGVSPRESIEAESRRRGRETFISGCVAILRGEPFDDGLVFALAGPAATGVLDGREGGRHGYWPKVWAARGLLHIWDDRATPDILAATESESWRLREMAAKVVARHQIDAGLDAVLALQSDSVPRVRAAAGRAVRSLTAAAPERT